MVAGICQIPFSELDDSHPIDLWVIDQVARDRRRYEESLTYRAELVERKG